MFGSIGGMELLLIFVVALLIFGPRKLPELGKALGRGLSEFRRAANDLRDSLETEVARESGPKPVARPTLAGEPPAGTLEAAPAPTPAPPTDDARDTREQTER